MKIRKLHSLLLVVGILLAVAGACDTSECEGNRNSLPIAAFMSSTEQPYAIALDTIHLAGLGAPSDSILTYYSAEQAYIPFNNDSHVTRYVLEYNRIPQELFDTVTFEYDPEPWFESTDCGVFYKYEIQRITHTTHFIDSVTCPSGVIDNTPGQNIFIYLRTQTAMSSIAVTHE